MKKTTLIYCGPDTHAGVDLAKSMRGPEHLVFLRDAGTFDGKAERCDGIHIMPDVAHARALALENAYQDRIKYSLFDRTDFDHPRPCKIVLADLSVKHRGHGKFYVMRGDEIVSGPHDGKNAALQAMAA